MNELNNILRDDRDAPAVAPKQTFVRSYDVHDTTLRGFLAELRKSEQRKREFASSQELLDFIYKKQKRLLACVSGCDHSFVAPAGPRYEK